MFDHGHTAGSGHGVGGSGRIVHHHHHHHIYLKGREIAEAVSEDIDYGIGGYTC